MASFNPPPTDQNKVIGNPLLSDNSVTFGKGSCGNILYCEEGIDLRGSSISFNGNNALVYLSKNKHRYSLNASINRDSVLYIGENNYFNGRFNLILSERKHIVIGADGLFSFGIWLRTADPHLIYSCNTYQRINPSKNILIGDHVWIGQGSLVLKGSSICSGSIIGANSTVSGKKICSNESWGGAPAKRIAQNVFFDGACVHNWTEEQTEKSQSFSSDKWDFTKLPAEQSAVDGIFFALDSLPTAEERLSFLLAKPTELQGKYRFAAKAANEEPKQPSRLTRLIRKIVNP